MKLQAALSCLLLLVSPAAAIAGKAPTFTKAFAPDVIGPGSVSVLTFTIDNGNVGAPVSNLAFTDTLPAAVTIANPSRATSTCGGTVTAPPGGSAISFSDGVVGLSATCTVVVHVTSSTSGMHSNVSGDLTSSAGNSGTASADLTVDSGLPGFSKSFSPSSVSLGGRSTLTFTIDNTANEAAVTSLAFTDNLPPGMVIADPTRAASDCGTPPTLPPVLVAEAGAAVVGLSIFGGSVGFPAVAGGASCTVTVDVVVTGVGVLENVSSNLAATGESSGLASDTLEVTVTPLSLRKDFTDDPVPAGGSATLELRVDNFDRDFAATGVAFDDDLGASLAGLTVSSLLANDCGGAVTGVGTTMLALSGGVVAPESSCTVRVSLAVPAAAAAGAYVNTTSTVTGQVDGAVVVGNAASETLFVEPIPLLTKEFLDPLTLGPDPVVNAGEDVVLRFTVANTSTTSEATDIEFVDELTTFLPVPVSVTLPSDPDPPCGPGSSLLLIPLAIDGEGLFLSGGNLAAAASCTFDVTVSIPDMQPASVYVNTTEEVTATVDGATRIGRPASDDLTVIAAPRLVKAFTDDPAAPGGAVTLEFTLTHAADAPGDAGAITFTDDLAPVLAGLTANLPPTPDPPCGAGSSLTGSAGDTLLTLAGGTLMSGESCTFSVVLDVPAAADAGSFGNTTSEVSATVQGLAVTSVAASDNLVVSGLLFSKEFLGDPVVPGDTVVLRFTIDNVHPTDQATAVSFTDDLAQVLPATPDLTVSGPLPTTPCGAGSMFQAIGSTLQLTGGILASGESCTFDVSLTVPAGAPNGAFSNVTDSLSAMQGGGGVLADPASDALLVDAELLGLEKEFTDDPVAPGGPVTLDLTLTNLDPARAAADVAFSDDLAAALPGLTFDAVLLDTCGGLLTGAGTTTVMVSGVALAAAGSCTLRLSLSVPSAAAANLYTNTTSAVSGMIDGFAVSGSAASDTLQVLDLLLFGKSFDGPTTATGTTLLTFTITNPGSGTAIELAFSDDLDAVLSGLVATGLPLADVCGAGSLLSGTSFLTFTGGSLGPLSVCSFDLDLSVPAIASAGSFPNVTSDLLQSGLVVAPPAVADLVVEPPPAFAKAFAPDSILTGQVSTLTFTIDNTASVVPASNLDFSDSLPAGVVVADPANGTTACAGGILTATPGTATVSFTGGTVAAGASCTVQVDTTSTTPGAFVNTSGELTSSAGDSGTASATLVVNPPPTFTKTFVPDSIATGGISRLTLTVDNGASTVAATGLAFSDDLPAGVLVAAPANASTTCSGGTLTAVAGSGQITYSGGSVAGGASCEVAVDVASDTPGTYLNTASELSVDGGTSPAASDTLTVVDATLVLSKMFVPPAVLPGGLVELEFTLTNTAPGLALSDIAFSDDLDAALPGLAATTTPIADVCGAGSQLAGTSVLSLTGGSLAAGASCTFAVTLKVPGDAPTGTFANTTSEVTATAPGGPVSGPASMTNLTIVYFDFDKTFSGPAGSGEVVTLTFVIVNPDPANGATDLSFSDDLDAVVPGLEAVGLPLADVCGLGSQLAGTSVITLTGGILGPGASCSFAVDVLVPGSLTGGDSFTNITSPLAAVVDGTPVAGGLGTAATALLVIASGVPSGVLEIPTLDIGAMVLFGILLAALAWRRSRSIRAGNR